jgi:hypothetical protein
VSHQRLCDAREQRRHRRAPVPIGRGVQVTEPMVKSADAGSKRQSTSISATSSARPTPTRKRGSSKVLRAPILLKESATAMSEISTPSGAGRSPYHSEPSIEAPNSSSATRHVNPETPARAGHPAITPRRVRSRHRRVSGNRRPAHSHPQRRATSWAVTESYPNRPVPTTYVIGGLIQSPCQTRRYFA